MRPQTFQSSFIKILGVISELQVPEAQDVRNLTISSLSENTSPAKKFHENPISSFCEEKLLRDRQTNKQTDRDKRRILHNLLGGDNTH